MSGFADQDRLARVTLADEALPPRDPAIKQELDVALYDLGEDNRFRPLPRENADVPDGPYALTLGVVERHVAATLETEAGTPISELRLPLAPLRDTISDYFAICAQYFDAVKRLTPAQIEAIDMGRRGIHDEGADLLLDRLAEHVATDHETARRLFTVICALSHPQSGS